VVAGYALQRSCIWAVGDTQTTIARIAVTATSDQLCALVRSYSSRRGIATALCQILRAAQRVLDRGHPRAAAHILRAFTRIVSRLTGRAFTPDEADVLKLLASSLGAGNAGGPDSDRPASRPDRGPADRPDQDDSEDDDSDSRG